MVIAMAFRFYQPVWPVQRREVLENANYSQSYQVATTSIAAVPDMVSSQGQINTVSIKLTSAFYRSLPNTAPRSCFHCTVQSTLLPSQRRVTPTLQLPFIIQSTETWSISTPYRSTISPTSKSSSPWPHPHLVLSINSILIFANLISGKRHRITVLTCMSLIVY